MSPRLPVIVFSALVAGLVYQACGGVLSAAGQDAAKVEELVYPGEKYEKLSYFVGSWEGPMKITPDKQVVGGTVTGRATFEPIVDGHCMKMTYEQDPAEGQGRVFKGFGILSWNKVKRMYHFWWFDNFGVSRDASGTWKGDTLEFKFNYGWQQGIVEEVITFKTTSPTEYYFELKNGFPGRTKLTTRMKGSLTKKP